MEENIDRKNKCPLVLPQSSPHTFLLINIFFKRASSDIMQVLPHKTEKSFTFSPKVDDPKLNSVSAPSSKVRILG